LHEHEQLAAGLRARADATPPLPAGVLARALARIDAPPPLAHTIPLHTPWFAAPARYATAAVLVVGFGAVAAAAWHVREANVAQEGQSAAVYGVRPSTATPPMMAQAKVNVNAVRTGAPKPATIAAQTTVERQHRLAKHAQLEIVVTEVEPALRRAQATARAADGVVVSLVDARPSTPGTLPGADLVLEVPAQRLGETLDRLAQLGTVRNRTVNAEDLGDAIVDQEARLTNLRRTETDLRALMDKGGKVDEILTVQQNLSEVRGQIEQLQAQHEHDVHRVATSTIALNLIEQRPNPPAAKPGPTARIDGAWHSGVSALADTLVALFSALAFGLAYSPVPLGAATLGYAAWRLGRRLATTARQA
jgi:hypothetical protein